LLLISLLLISNSSLSLSCYSPNYIDRYNKGLVPILIQRTRTSVDTIIPLISYSSCNAAGRPLCPILTLLIITLRLKSYRFISAAANVFTLLVGRTQYGVYLAAPLAVPWLSATNKAGNSIVLISPSSSALSSSIVIRYSCLTP